MNLFKSKIKRVIVPCDCRCCELSFEKEVDEDCVTYDVSVLDSRYDHGANGVPSRIRNAFRVLLGKPVCYNEVCIDPERFDQLIDDLVTLREWEPIEI